MYIKNDCQLTGTLRVIDLVAPDGGHDRHFEARIGVQVEGRLRVHNVAGYDVRIPGGGRRAGVSSTYTG